MTESGTGWDWSILAGLTANLPNGSMSRWEIHTALRVAGLVGMVPYDMVPYRNVMYRIMNVWAHLV